MVKNPSAMWETWVQSLSWEDPLEKGMVTHSSILGWRIPWIEEPAGLQSMRLQRVDTTEQLSLTILKLFNFILMEVFPCVFNFCN